MLIIFKNCIIFYLYIMSYTCSSQPEVPPVDQNEEDEVLAVKHEKRVQKLVLPFAKYVSMIPDTFDRGEFKGKLDMLAWRAVMADEMLEERRAFENEKDKACYVSITSWTYI